MYLHVHFCCSIQTAPVVDTSAGNAFFGPSSDLLNQRRASDSTALGKNKVSTSTRTASSSSAGGVNTALSSSAPDPSPGIPR